jgi:tetratricopeptide (TPR) repeat protein
VIRIYRGEFAKAEDELRVARQVEGDQPIFDSNEALLWAKRGEQEKAQQALARALQDKPSIGHDHHRWHSVAAVYAVLGRPDQAIEQIRRASQTGFPCYPTFQNDPHFASLHAEPEWKTLTADLEREDAEFRSEFGHHP